MSVLTHCVDFASGLVTRRALVGIVCGGALLAAAPLASAQTLKGGLILGETWTVAESPYLVIADLNIAALTIKPGVVVEVEAGWKIGVTGSIKAVGTECAPIVFRARDPASPWAGFQFEDTPPGSEFVHCVIQDSNSSAIHILRISEPFVMRDCTIQDNSADSTGGGGLLLQSTSATPILLERCVFQRNSTRDAHGGGIRIGSASVAPLELVDCDFRDNTVGRSGRTFSVGGGIYAPDSNVALLRCFFVGNLATGFQGTSGATARGAGVYLTDGTLTIENSGFTSNTLSANGAMEGAGVYVAGGTCTIINSTFARNNKTGIHQGGGTVAVRNSILFNNNGNGTQYGGTVSFEYCNVQGPTPPLGPGNINYNPIFASLTGGERWAVTITSFSPCVDKGDPTIVDCGVGGTAPYGVQYPYSGSPASPTSDMGMHGGPEGCGWAPACFADMDKSTGPGVLDIFDFLAFQNAFVAGDPYAINCDMSTGCDEGDIFDFLCFQNAFVKGCP